MRERFLCVGVAALALCFTGCSDASEVGGTTTLVDPEPPSPGGVPVPWRPGGLTAYPGAPPLKPSGTDPGLNPECVEWYQETFFTMSADDSNSMGSPGYAREMLLAMGTGTQKGMAPDPKLIRTHEFLNYYNAGYAPAEPGTLSIVPQLMKGDVAGQYRLQVGVQAPLPEASRRAMTVTIVVDTSQSMAGQSIRNARAVVKEIAESLRPGDQVNLVTLDAEAKPLLDGQPITGSGDIDAVKGVADHLFVGGGSDLQGGLVRGYSLAYDHYSAGGINRLVLITDGRTNPTAVNSTFIAGHTKKGDDAGIYLVGVGTGPAEGYNDELLNKLTDAGRGAYVYIDSEAEAHKVFSTRFSEVMEIAARSVAVSITLPINVRLQRFYGEKVSDDSSEIEPQHLAAGDSMVFNMILETCHADATDLVGELYVHVTWETPIDKAPRIKVARAQLKDLGGGDLKPIQKSSAVVAYAEALKSLDASRISKAAKSVEDAYEVTKDEDLKEIHALLLRHPALQTLSPGN